MAERFELDAIAADDALLDRLAAGGGALFDALEAGGDDPAVRMLGGLRVAVEVVEDERPGSPDDELERILARDTDKGSGVDPLARKIATRTLALGVAAVAGLSVSGVAAAVTGDPLSPYEKIVEKVVDGLRPQSTFPIKSVGGVVSSKSASKKAVTEYRAEVKRKGGQGSQILEPEVDDRDKVIAIDDLLGRDRNRIEPDLPPLVTKEPTLTDNSGKDKVTPPLEKDPGDTGTDDTGTEPKQPTETKVDPTPPPTDPTIKPEEPVEPVNPEPTPDPTTQPTQPTTDPTTDPSPTPTQTQNGEDNQPSTGDGDTNTAPGDQGSGSSDGKTDGSQGGGENQASEDQASEDQPTVPPTTQPSVPSDSDKPDSSDSKPAEKPTDESSASGSGSDRAEDTDRTPAPSPVALASEVVQRIIATLNGVMISR